MAARPATRRWRACARSCSGPPDTRSGGCATCCQEPEQASSRTWPSRPPTTRSSPYCGELGTFEGRSRFTTWAYKFGVLHAGVAVRRQAWRHREVPLPDTLTLVDTAPTPAAVSEASQLARAVEAAIATELTPHQRRVVLALLVEQVPIDVLAERLGSTRNALYKTLHDARRRLRTALIESGHLQIRPDRSTP